MAIVPTVKNEENCAQIIARMIFERFNVPEQETYIKLLHGMAYDMQEGSICGALSGGFFAINALLTERGISPSDITTAQEEFRRNFKKIFGAVNCEGITANVSSDEQPQFCKSLIDSSSKEVEELINLTVATFNPIMIRLNRY